MARMRTLKPEFWTDEVIVALSFPARLFYQGCWNFAVCDRGHLDDSPTSLKLKILPADDVDPVALIDELIKFGRLVRKQMADGGTYLQIPTLDRHSKADTRWSTRCRYCAHEATSEPADPPSNTGNLAGTPASPGEPSGAQEKSPREVKEGKGKEGKGKFLGAVHASAHPPPPDNTADAEPDTPVPKPSGPPKPSGAKGTRIPDDFTVTAAMVEWAGKTCPGVDGRRETEKFVNHWRAKSGRDATKINWELTWRNWMLRAAEYAPARASPPQAHRSTTDDRVNAALNLAAQIRREGQLELEKPP